MDTLPCTCLDSSCSLSIILPISMNSPENHDSSNSNHFEMLIFTPQTSCSRPNQSLLVSFKPTTGFHTSCFILCTTVYTMHVLFYKREHWQFVVFTFYVLKIV